MHVWPMEEAPALLAALAEAAGLSPIPLSGEALPEAPDAPISRLAEAMGLELQPLSLAWADADRFAATGGPALIRVQGGWLGLLPGGRTIRPDRADPARAGAGLARVLRSTAEEKAGPQVDRVLARAALSAPAAARCRRALLAHRLQGVTLPMEILLLRAAPHRALPALRRAGLFRRAALLAGLALLQQALVLGGWWLMGGAMLSGARDSAAWSGWAILLICGALLQAWMLRLQGEISLIGGQALRRHMLQGVLHPDTAVQRLGIGGALTRAGEAQSVEGLGLSAAFSFLLGGVQLLAAIPLLYAGAGGAPLVLLLSLLLLLLILGRRYALRRLSWAEARLQLSAEALSGMVGYRTRLAQIPPEQWHNEEDRSLLRYVRRSRRMDQAAVELEVLLPNLWKILGMAALLPALLHSGAGASASAGGAALAVGVGAVLYAHAALLALLHGAAAATDLWIVWRTAGALIAAGSQPGDPPGILTPPPGPHALDAVHVRSQPPDRPPVLRSIDLHVPPRARVLLLGPSGSGKSTLAAVLAGLRPPRAGALRFGGLDPGTVGAAEWRRRIAMTPQFHENHLFDESLAFNLLLGRGWPPSPADLEEAAQLCRLLGLGPLLQHMPGGLQQQVGESGWPLSHGERSRVLLARTMLQQADVWILDECFSALDPHTLERCLRVVLARAPTLIVLEHV